MTSPSGREYTPGAVKRGESSTGAGIRGVLGSNYGARNVDIAALDENFTTFLQNGRSSYRLAEGTSNSGPVVAGIAALTLAVRPDLSAAALKKILMDNATRLPALAGKIACGGMVNAYSSLRAAAR